MANLIHFTNEDLKKMKRALDKGKSIQSLATRYVVKPEELVTFLQSCGVHVDYTPGISESERKKKHKRPTRVDPMDIYNLYTVERMKTKEIAELLNIHQQTVHKHVRENNWYRARTMNLINEDETWLLPVVEKMYLRQKDSVDTIADATGHSVYTIRETIKKNGWRDVRRELDRKERDINKTLIFHMYIVTGMNAFKISKCMDMHVLTVRKVLKDNNWEGLGKKHKKFRLEDFMKTKETTQ